MVIERRALVNTANNALYSKAIGVTKINLAFIRKANRDLHTEWRNIRKSPRGFLWKTGKRCFSDPARNFWSK